MDGESIKYYLAKNYQKINLQIHTTKFFKSCISEGFLPKGLNVNFNLAIDVNDQELVTKIERILDDQGSRILDTLYIKSQSLEIFLDEQYQKLIVRFRELYPEEEVRVFIRKVKDD